MKLQDIIKRIVAVFGAEAFTAIGCGALFGVELWKSAAIAGGVAASTVTGKVLRAYANDQRIDKEEARDIFGGQA